MSWLRKEISRASEQGRGEVREVEKVDQTIHFICDQIQKQLDAEQIELTVKLIKALAMLITAKANSDMSIKMRKSERIIRNHQT